MNTEDLLPLLYQYSLKFAGAVAVLVIGMIIVGALTRTADRLMEKREIEATLRSFLKALISAALKVMVILSALSVLASRLPRSSPSWVPPVWRSAWPYKAASPISLEG